ncbi:5488_t:CDS:2 [Cetraspora pellucida]|uniref:5488_t:CDS:1 n=1 Tax=Cetraspora pellucida TaxID=1433469 RepID=A0A9N9BAB4_9GLOM|nr:5488_t:CDS:2 [Cetraspora pellucida]
MPSVSHSLSTSRCNVTVACDSCPKKRGHKKCCPNPITTTPLPPHKIIEFNVDGLWEMLDDLSQQIDSDYDLSTQDLINNDQMEILSSTSSLPCLHENTAGHCCHKGCIGRFNNGQEDFPITVGNDKPFEHAFKVYC